MKSRTSSLLLLSCVVIMSVTYVFTASATQQENGENSRPSWEHLALSQDGAGLVGNLSKQIIRLGNEGWRLVCVSTVVKEGTTEKTIYYFKRPK